MLDECPVARAPPSVYLRSALEAVRCAAELNASLLVPGLRA